MDEQQNIVIYRTADGKASVALYARDGKIWLNQQQMAELFATSNPNISMHIANILKEKELYKDSVVKEYLTTAADGKNYKQNDSALRAWLKANPNKSYYPNRLCLHGREYSFWTEYQYGYFYVRENELTEWAIMPFPEITHYRYSEPWPSMKWQLEDERQTVCGYQCQKATCHWRGRDYVAWFTTRIPLKSGPWKFGGLPGLIMKVYDSRHIYTWEAVSVENGSFPIYQPDEHMYKKSTRQKVWKMQIDWNKRHNELAGVLDFNFHPKTKRYPYDPQELE